MTTIEALEEEIRKLRSELHNKEQELRNLKKNGETDKTNTNASALSKAEIERYSRQIILPEIGVEGQLKLKRARVLVVGAGGLGCPSMLYLAAAGIGHIGIVDYDTVEPSNLHRQVLHSESSVGESKVLSAAHAINRLNSFVEVTPIAVQLNSQTALNLIQDYDVVVDGTDNPASRYLLNDACVLAKRPLVSGSALGLEGQLTVFGADKEAPCYRCLFPTPPPVGAVASCGDAGVIGAVPGVIGVLQSLEVIKILTGCGSPLSRRLVVFDSSTGLFRNIKLRGRNPNCSVCGDTPTLTQLIDYEQFCGAKASDKDLRLTLIPEEERITPTVLADELVKKKPLFVDVRSAAEFSMVKLPGFINIPYKELTGGSGTSNIRNLVTQRVQDRKSDNDDQLSLIVVCRRGNNSQLAVKHLREALTDLPVSICDVIGGLHGWSRSVDSTFPIY